MDPLRAVQALRKGSLLRNVLESVAAPRQLGTIDWGCPMRGALENEGIEQSLERLGGLVVNAIGAGKKPPSHDAAPRVARTVRRSPAPSGLARPSAGRHAVQAAPSPAAAAPRPRVYARESCLSAECRSHQREKLDSTSRNQLFSWSVKLPTHSSTCRPATECSNMAMLSWFSSPKRRRAFWYMNLSAHKRRKQDALPYATSHLHALWRWDVCAWDGLALPANTNKQQYSPESIVAEEGEHEGCGCGEVKPEDKNHRILKVRRVLLVEEQSARYGHK
eukprot:scaffold808_cov370-Prasinococcus_capsulatus_cf.AAC.14